jgi:EAL domain-containing protein (putative c-di-GMP-specific phosphodiesterase class I)/CHASE2 domain-containing sensor protein
MARLSRHWRITALVLSVFAGLLTAAGGLGGGLEDTLKAANAQLRRHPASGGVHIVEIDAQSIAAIDRWPWPRRNYAEVVDRLRLAGAASIAFDVDFSSHADPLNDADFAAALGRAGGKVILPTFGQRAGAGKAGWMDSLPIPALREHATLAAVSILPDEDGTVRRAPIGTATEGLPRPSLSATVAGVSGAIDHNFPIDFAIDPVTIPRHSFVDVRDGKLDRSAIAGKHVIIGATAVEMGDRYAVPNYGVIPGVVIQALAAETLREGLPRDGGWLLPILFALNCAWLTLHLRRRSLLVAAAVAGPAAIFGLSVAASALFYTALDIVPALAAVICAAAFAYTKQLIAAAHFRRSHDPATGLPNRLALVGTLRPSAGSGIVVARFADYDKLATSLGDKATADLVRRVHDRIVLVAEGSTIYRPEDRVLAWRFLNADDVEDRLESLRALMLNPIEVAGRRVDVALVFGFAKERHAEHADRTLLRAMLAADHALEHEESWHVHDASEDEEIGWELSLLGELDEAIVNGGIEVAFQPKLCLKTGKIVSVEALVRWNHATRGRLGPDLFIPLAERNGRIGGLTLHVLDLTIQNLQWWRALGYEISGAVNISAKLLNSPGFLADLRRMIDDAGISPGMLVFEVTESATMMDSAQACAALRSFQAMGIAISIDDYGTGQSTLSYLKQLPLNELKIDRSFVQFVHQNRSDAVLVQSTVNLAHELGLKVVAEGVETEECKEFLRSIGCDMIQGYLVSRPVAPLQLVALLGQQRARAA